MSRDEAIEALNKIEAYGAAEEARKIALKSLQSDNRLQKTLSQIIDEVSGEICDNFCKYRSTVDEDILCDYIRNGRECPLDRLQ